jgi:hypothetical protein
MKLEFIVESSSHFSSAEGAGQESKGEQLKNSIPVFLRKSRENLASAITII